MAFEVGGKGCSETVILSLACCWIAILAAGIKSEKPALASRLAGNSATIDVGCLSSSVVEQLFCKQLVAGSIPV